MKSLAKQSNYNVPGQMVQVLGVRISTLAAHTGTNPAALVIGGWLYQMTKLSTQGRGGGVDHSLPIGK